MNSAIKQRNPNPLTQAQVVAYISGAAVEYTADHDITVSEYGKRIVHGFAATAEHTFTLPTLTSLNDGIIYTVINKSYYKLTVDCESSDDHVWQGSLGVEMPDIWTSITVQGNLAANCWDIIHKAGGRVIVQGVVLQPEDDRLHKNTAGSAGYGIMTDKARKHLGTAYGTLYCSYVHNEAKFPPSYIGFNGSTDYLQYHPSDDFNIFGSQDGVMTASGWLRPTDLSANMFIIAQSDSPYDANNTWYIYFAATTGSLHCYMVSGGTNRVAINAGAFSAGDWQHWALIRVGANVGFFINGVQVGFDDSWTVDTFSGPLIIGQNSNGSGFFLGRMQDLHIAYNDTLGLSAAPNAGLTSTYTVPAAPMNLVF